jgi:phage-related protein
MAVFGGLTPSADSQQTQQTMVVRVLSFAYGNGYDVMIPDGANPTRDTWQITFDSLSAADTTTLNNWLKANPPWVTWNGDGVLLDASLTYRVTLDSWQRLAYPGTVNGFTFNVEQVF